jgi:hypothetical protein
MTQIFSRSRVEKVRRLVEQLEELQKLRDRVRRAEVRAITQHRRLVYLGAEFDVALPRDRNSQLMH